MILVWLWIFLVGLAIGSFLNVVVYRVLTGESPFKGRSKCDFCQKQIAWYDNIPLLSFVFLKGRCRNCGKKISWRYPILELLSGCLFVWWFAVGQMFFRLTQLPYKTVQPVFWLIIGVGLTSLAVADLFYGVLPDVFTISLTILALLYRAVLTIAGIIQLTDFALMIVSALGAAGFFWGLKLITKDKGMGMGDVKLALLMGLLLGWPKILVAQFAAFLTGALAGIILIIAGKKKFGQTIPFGPFLVWGTAIALVWGEKIIGIYLRMMGI